MSPAKPQVLVVVPPDVQAFVASSRARGLPDTDIRQQLIAAGWTLDVINAALLAA
jgi:hypothetical protein